jgi:hypothetical protein
MIITIIAVACMGRDVEIDNGTRRQAPSTRVRICSRPRADFFTGAALPVAIGMPPGLRTWDPEIYLPDKLLYR